MAKSLGVSVDEMIAAMKIARSDSGVTFSQALKGVTGKDIDTEKAITTNTFTSNITNVGKALKDVGSSVLAAGQSAYTALENKLNNLDANIKDTAYHISQNAAVDSLAQKIMAVNETIQNKVENVENQLSTKKEEPDRGAGTRVTSNLKAVNTLRDESKMDYSIRRGYGFNTGGQVSSPVGQLANMLRSNRLGYNQGGAVQSGYYGYQEGGQINMQEMGFVNGKTPDQVTDAQSVADTEAMSADEGDFVINAPAVEAVGVEAIIGLVSDALTLATEEGVEIVDIPQDTSPEVMVDILVSEGEFIVPRELIPFIEGGIETLEKINALGTDEVSQRVDETAMMEQDIAAEEGLPPEELPAEEMMMETPDQVPAPPTFNTGGIVTLDFNYNRGFI